MAWVLEYREQFCIYSEIKTYNIIGTLLLDFTVFSP